MQTQASKFRIVREDLNVDPVTLVTDGLKIGRQPSCEVVLNHPTVSRLHAGVTMADGRYYLYNFSSSSGTTLNGRVVATESGEVLADGDVVQIGPFFLAIDRVGDALNVSVTFEVALTAGEAESRGEAPTVPSPFRNPPAKPEAESNELAQALNVFWEKRKREAGKMQRVSHMRPRKPARVLGKARFNWTPTRDLVRPWPFSVFVWGTALVAVLSVVAAYVYAEAYAPAPISNAHAASAMRSQPPIAARANASSCTSCHSLSASVETNCSTCHQAPAFKAAVTEPHARAGIGCTACHVEHQGTEFRPAVASLQTCTTCHSDANTKTYDGRAVHTPHGGTYGYPVRDGKWVWKGLPDEEWAQKSPALRKLVLSLRGPLLVGPRASGRDPEDLRRSAEFHSLHVNRVRLVGDLKGDKDGEMSCNSCHLTHGANTDIETPRKTCALCHNGDRGGKFEKILADDKPNCISCHVQHLQARREWGRALLKDLSAASPNLQPGGEPAPPR
ncbi:MAG TPA: FHA domain-containing protein [Pyrinomonadaceae bacterium]|jgi:pSer/pThr/pTyr-binding forkhead associated (FHA) protein